MEDLTWQGETHREQPLSSVALSALWAAWGDALGFPFELTQFRDAQAALQHDEVIELEGWTRRVGGRFGAHVPFPAGTYSDDTQLRLAVSRCLRANGRFDAEAFSKVELPVFLSYELGAGRGTKRAARALTNRATRWNNNFFADGDVVYVEGGGNGAAMRIQPHVWAAPGFDREQYLPGLLRDAVTTHGHPIGIIGALVHAFALEVALNTGSLPGLRDWDAIGKSLPDYLKLFEADDRLGVQWFDTWERTAHRSFEAEWLKASSDCFHKLQIAEESLAGSEPLDRRYAQLVERLGGFDKQTRGSAVVTSILALWIAVEGDREPVRALHTAASMRGSDTDTIATMAGALLGAIAENEPSGPIQDREYIVADAHWLDSLRTGQRPADFPHPDPLYWQPPGALADALGRGTGGRESIAGLGPCTAVSRPYAGGGKDAAAWQWFRLDFGQSVLIKRREQLAPLPSSALPRERDTAPSSNTTNPAQKTRPQSAEPLAELPNSVDEAVELIRRYQFDPLLLGLLVEHLGALSNGPEKAGIFAALATQARRRL